MSKPDNYGQCKNHKCGRFGELREDGQCLVCNPRPKNQTGNAPQAIFPALQEMYTDQTLSDTLATIRANNVSFHQIKNWLDNGENRGITHMDIKRAIAGQMPKSARKRAAMRLHPLAVVPACPLPGCTEEYRHLHGLSTYDPQTQAVSPIAAKPVNAKPATPRAPRIAISKDNPASAARSIVDNLHPAVVKQLIRNLLTITNG